MSQVRAHRHPPQSPPYKYTCTSSWLMTKFCRSTKKFCRSCSLVGLGPIPPAATSVTVLQDELVNIWVLWALLLRYFIVNFFEVRLLAPKASVHRNVHAGYATSGIWQRSCACPYFVPLYHSGGTNPHLADGLCSCLGLSTPIKYAYS